MFLDQFPGWDDKHFQHEGGESWKHNQQRQKAMLLYNQGTELLQLSHALCDTLQPTEDIKDVEEFRHMIMQNAMTLCPKIRGAEVTSLYTLKMENASVIRYNCRQLSDAVNAAILMGIADENFKEAFDAEIDEFRVLFKDWVSGFTKDDYEDEWGLY